MERYEWKGVVRHIPIPDPLNLSSYECLECGHLVNVYDKRNFCIHMTWTVGKLEEERYYDELREDE